jgi:hypothetical protein
LSEKRYVRASALKRLVKLAHMSFWWPVSDNMFVEAWPTPDELVQLAIWQNAMKAAKRDAPELARYVEELRPLPKAIAKFRLHRSCAP